MISNDSFFLFCYALKSRCVYIRHFYGLFRLQPDFRIQVSFRMRWNWLWNAFWVWLFTFQDSDLNLVAAMIMYVYFCFSLISLEAEVSVFLLCWFVPQIRILEEGSGLDDSKVEQLKATIDVSGFLLLLTFFPAYTLLWLRVCLWMCHCWWCGCCFCFISVWAHLCVFFFQSVYSFEVDMHVWKAGEKDGLL